MRIAILILVTCLILGAVLIVAKDFDDEPVMSPQQIEEKVMRELSEGRQAEAEQFLDSQLRGFPDTTKVISLFEYGHRDDAAKLLNSKREDLRKSQRVFFLLGTLIRSRFDIMTACGIFNVVYAMEKETPAGACALHVCALDSNELHIGDPKRVDEEFLAFTKLADANPDDVVIRWMLAVQCRSWARNKDGVVQYKKILEKWNPGPVLVHQTYGNLLDELDRHEEALVERRKAVEMEPSGWTYDGLAIALHGLKRFQEAYEAHGKAIEFEPNNPRNWNNWALTLYDEGKYDEAIEKCETAIELDRHDFRPWWNWGKCLVAQGKKKQALEKYRNSLALQPRNESLRSQVAALEKELTEESKAPRKVIRFPNSLIVVLDNDVKLELVRISAGEFLMGTTANPAKKSLDYESPQHRVRISKPFYLGKYLVTREQWKLIMGRVPNDSNEPNIPVEDVSWDDCQQFLGKLNEKMDRQIGTFQLPTEAQWEYACRAGSTTRYYFGDDKSKLGEFAWYGENSDGKLHPVGEKKPNAWGLYDMYGNVFEWCRDWYDWDYYRKSPADDPMGPTTGCSRRVLRGGSVITETESCRSASRIGTEPGIYRYHIGLRVSMAPPE